MIKNASFLLQMINNNEIDLENMSDNRVNCAAWAKAYKKMQKELLNEEAEVVDNLFGDHTWLFFGHKADATADSDLTRVKMRLSTYGYDLSTSKDQFIYDPLTPQKLKKMDRNIHYITENYLNFEPIVSVLKMDFQNSNMKNEDSLLWWIHHLRDTFYSFQSTLKYFEDVSFCLEYLFRYFLPREIKATYERFPLFDDSSDDWNFMDIYRIYFLKETLYYALLPTNSGYDFIEVPYSDVIHYISSFKGPRREILLKR